MRAEWDEALVNEYTFIMTSRGGPLWYVCKRTLRFLMS